MATVQPPEGCALTPETTIHISVGPETKTRRVLVAIPCQNQELAIAGIVLRAKKHSDEVLVIDDGSTDRTAEVARMAGATVLVNDRNSSQGYGVRRAFRYAYDGAFDALVLLDGSGRHNPEEIPQMLEPILGRNGSSVDMSFGALFAPRGRVPSVRGSPDAPDSLPTHDGHLGFRAFGRRAIVELLDGFTFQASAFESQLLAQAKARGLQWDNVVLALPEEPIPAHSERKRVVAAIPAYNEEIAIGSVVLRVRRFVDEVVVIDDGSKDATARVASLAGARVVQHVVNGGYGAALKTAFRLAKEEGWDALVILDSDGQHNPEDIPEVVKPIFTGDSDVSIGSRFVKDETQQNIPAYRKLGIKVLTEMNNVGASANQRVRDGQSGFRAYSRAAIAAIEPKDADMGISAEILFQARAAGCKFTEVPIHVRYDVDGSSQGPIQHGVGVVRSILKFAEREYPIVFFGIPGFIALFAGLLLGGFALMRYFSNHWLPFGPTVGAAGLTTVGLLMAFTGVILHAVNSNRK